MTLHPGNGSCICLDLLPRSPQDTSPRSPHTSFHRTRQSLARPKPSTRVGPTWSPLAGTGQFESFVSGSTSISQASCLLVLLISERCQAELVRIARPVLIGWHPPQSVPVGCTPILHAEITSIFGVTPSTKGLLTRDSQM